MFCALYYYLFFCFFLFQIRFKNPPGSMYCRQGCLQVMYQERKMFLSSLLDFQRLLFGVGIDRQSYCSINNPIDDAIGITGNVDVFSLGKSRKKLAQDIVLGDYFYNVKTRAQAETSVDLRAVV